MTTEIKSKIVTGRTATLVVAASDATVLEKAQADLTVNTSGWETDVQAQITAGAGGRIVFFGTFTKGTTTGLAIPSNTTIDIQGTFTFITNVGDTAQMFKNSDPSGGNTGIRIINGIIDGNRTNQATGTQTAIYWDKVCNSKVDTLIQNFHGYNVNEVTETTDYGNSIINRAYPDSVAIPETRQRVLDTSGAIVLDLCSAGWTQTAGTITHDATVTFGGESSMKMVSAAGAPGHAIATKAISGIPDPSLYTVGLMVRGDPTGFTSLRVRFCRVTSSSYVDVQLGHFTISSGQWTLLLADNYPYSSSGALDLQRLATMEIITDSTTSGTIWVAKLMLIPNNISPALVTFSFDTAYVEAYTTFKPLFDAHGWSAVVSAVSKPGSGYSIGDTGYCTIAQLQSLQDSGWDIANHTWLHYMPTLITPETITPAEFEDDMRLGQQWLISHGFIKGSRFYVIDGGYFAQDYQWGLGSKYNALARSNRNGTMASNVNLFEAGYIPCSTDMNGFSLITMKALVDRAVANGMWVNFYGHNSASDLGALLTYIAGYGSKIKVVTWSDVYDNYITPIKKLTYANYQEHFQDLNAANATLIVNGGDVSGAVPVTLTIAAQPACPRTVTWAFVSHVNITLTQVQVDITGVDQYGNTRKYSANPAVDGWSGESSIAFAKITSCIVSIRTGTGAGDTINIGTGSKIGLANPIDATTDVYKVKKGTSDYPAASYTVNATYNTVDLSTGGAILDGDDFTIWYKSNTRR